MNVLLRQDKRGVSEVIGYVILIVIAVSLSVGVYAFLRQQIPHDQEACPTDVTLSIDKIDCSGGVLNVTIANRGLFSADGVVLKIGDVGSSYKTMLCLNAVPESDPTCSLFNATSTTHIALKSGDSWKNSFSYATTGQREVTVEPTVISAKTGRTLLCDGAVISQRVTCGGSP